MYRRGCGAVTAHHSHETANYHCYHHYLLALHLAISRRRRSLGRGGRLGGDQIADNQIVADVLHLLDVVLEPVAPAPERVVLEVEHLEAGVDVLDKRADQLRPLEVALGDGIGHQSAWLLSVRTCPQRMVCFFLTSSSTKLMTAWRYSSSVMWNASSVFRFTGTVPHERSSLNNTRPGMQGGERGGGGRTAKSFANLSDGNQRIARRLSRCLGLGRGIASGIHPLQPSLKQHQECLCSSSSRKISWRPVREQGETERRNRRESADPWSTFGCTCSTDTP
jgi:hypothetical protein